MARSWLVDSRGIANKVKNATLPAACQIKDCGAKRECTNCHYVIDNSDISYEWPGFPVGVKFEPSDSELIDHLSAKCGVGGMKPQKLIDIFIPTLDHEEGIYYAHPEKLPGAKKDGSSVYFFYRTKNAYSTGQRKRRKIQTESGSTMEQVRWHKTGRTKIVKENGIQKGCKKIMVLYKTSTRGSKPDKSNWVMHQYHLGTDEEEKEGVYVVSKIFYQQHKPNDGCEASVNVEEYEASRSSPRTPKMFTPEPPRLGATPDDVADDKLIDSPVQVVKVDNEALNVGSSDAQLKDDIDYAWLAGESQATDLEELLFCNEIMDSSTVSSDLGHSGEPLTGNPNNAAQGVEIPSSGLTELENLEIDTQPDYQLADLYFCSQDSIHDWFHRL
ncbi:OLC1v1011274C1 [Oldenlandia corymbosa var. corymbosa]|uniref:OLC1v1011274C1 n=1 Tax=Oldenlandia corymbosa var. corymbosa TaxID=529605 RepID=A0AAV1DTD1_OLDCO|nr:OLC1v1011274C1 [Oldenlandia corymbosa var. corymbosa]